MGGGDLNLKKSWHPSTMKNMEKVWKAEQQDNQEKKRIAELKRELALERDREEIKAFAMDQGVIEKKDDKKLDWMYKGPNEAVNREEYLLGRPIDKQFEQMVQTEKDIELNKPVKNHVEHECIPPSLRFFSGNEQVDLARKLQEDPLYTIKKKELETRSQLLKNPVKLKQLQQLVAQQKLKSKDNRMKKKRKRKSLSDLDERDNSRRLDELLTAKYRKLKGKINEADLIKSVKRHKKNKKIKKKKKKEESSDSSSSSSDSSSSSSSGSSSSSCSSSTSTRSSSSSSSRRRSSSSSSSSSSSGGSSSSRDSESESSSSSLEKAKRHKLKKYKTKDVDAKKYYHKNHKERGIKSLNNTHHDTRHKRRKETSHGESSKSYRNFDEEDASLRDKSRNYGLMKADGTRISPHKKHTSSREHSKDEAKTAKKEQKWLPCKKQKLSEEEKERKRQEMMDNASWRDKERKKNVKKYEEQERKEQMKSTSFDKNFLQKHLAIAANRETVASRIKSNINNIQRYKHSMDKNFAKR